MIWLLIGAWAAGVLAICYINHRIHQVRNRA